MAEHMKKRLELTDDQAAKFKDAMKKLGEQLKAKAPDSDIQASLDSLKTAHKAVAAEEEKFHDGLSFLTPTQRAKLLMGAMRMHREHERPGRARCGRAPRLLLVTTPKKLHCIPSVCDPARTRL